MGTSVAAVGEGLPRLAERFAAVGYQLVEDGMAVQLAPLAHVASAVEQVATVAIPEVPTAEQLAVLLVITCRGQVTHRAVEEVVGEDCETLLARLVARGFVRAERDDTQPRAPNVYRPTVKVLLATGHASLETLQAHLAELVGSVYSPGSMHLPPPHRGGAGIPEGLHGPALEGGGGAS
jgi:segregation and condensation protein B